MSSPFEYRKPTEDEAKAMRWMTDVIENAYVRLLTLAPANAERTKAIRKLQEARMWANEAILGGIELPR